VTPALLPLRTVEDLALARRDPVDADALAAATRIVEEVRGQGEAALRKYATRFGELAPGASLFLGRHEMQMALDDLPRGDRERLERVAGRIRDFAEQQRQALVEVRAAIPGGEGGHSLAPCERVGCYVPGGRYPLFSALLMTVIPARVAGVDAVWVATPRPRLLTMAAAAVAGADGILAAGGAQAVAALAYGCAPLLACDMVVGPGNRYVTAAKYLASRDVAIDVLAGPSELVVLADASADPALVAADLLAQTEHDPDAMAALVTPARAIVVKVQRAIARQLEDLPTASVARTALANGGAVLVGSWDEAAAACDRLAPQHLQLVGADAEALAPRLRHYGALFVGPHSPTALGDYGAGPNHVLPTGGTARSAGGLSVLSFLRVRTWLRIGDPAAASDLMADVAWGARQEGLEAHARSSRRAGS
jgi:histidinol dehydrogenase